MHITVLTHTGEAPRLRRLLEDASARRHPGLDFRLYDTYDDFIQGFPGEESQAVIVARRGADGMECARNAKLMRPTLPLIWLSDDPGFGIESYRIGCAFFSAGELTAALLSTALERCEHERGT